MICNVYAQTLTFRSFPLHLENSPGDLEVLTVSNFHTRMKAVYYFPSKPLKIGDGGTKLSFTQNMCSYHLKQGSLAVSTLFKISVFLLFIDI